MAAAANIDLADVGHTLENQGIAAFQASYSHVLGTLGMKATSWASDRPAVRPAMLQTMEQHVSKEWRVT